MSHFDWFMITTTTKNVGGSQNISFNWRVECLPLSHVCNSKKGKLWAKHMGLKCDVVGNTLGTKNSSYPPQQNSKEKNQALLLAFAHAHVNPHFAPKT
jgi:hypothetical protein